MNLLNFIYQFPDEASCEQKWKELRDKQGVICAKCGCESHYWKSDKASYECKSCGDRQSLRANTLMHGSWLPFRYWFAAIHLITITKKSFSANPRSANHIKMFVIEDLKAKTIDNQAINNIEKTSIIDSDDSTSYTNLSKIVAEHRPKVIPKELIDKSLP